MVFQALGLSFSFQRQPLGDEVFLEGLVAEGQRCAPASANG
jgi:hypothetical protein